MVNTSVLIVNGENRGDPALTMWFYGFDSQLVLGPVIPKTLEYILLYQ